MHILGQKIISISLGLSQKKKEIEKRLLRTSVECIQGIQQCLIFRLKHDEMNSTMGNNAMLSKHSPLGLNGVIRHFYV